jgi:hypothetical protein
MNHHVVHVSCICRVISLVHVKSQWLNGSDVIWDVNPVDNSFNHTLIYILFSAEDNSHLRTGRRPQYYSLVYHGVIRAKINMLLKCSYTV